MRMYKKLALGLAPVLAVAVLTATAPAANAASKYTVTVTMSKSAIDLGDKVTASGKVTPKAPGKYVKVYVHYASDSEGEYHYMGKDKLDKKSKFSKKFTPRDSGRTKVMVVKAPGKGKKAGKASKYIDNYGRVSLSALPRQTLRGVVAPSDTIDLPGGDIGTYSGYTFSGASGAQARWDTKYQCKGTMYADAGIDVSSPAGSAIANFTSENADFSTLRQYEGDVLTSGGSTEFIILPLTKKVGTTYKRPRYIDISTQVASGDPKYAVGGAELICNLPGGLFPTAGD